MREGVHRVIRDAILNDATVFAKENDAMFEYFVLQVLISAAGGVLSYFITKALSGC